jgi:hypothetical protein
MTRFVAFAVDINGTALARHDLAAPAFHSTKAFLKAACGIVNPA